VVYSHKNETIDVITSKRHKAAGGEAWRQLLEGVRRMSDMKFIVGKG